ncbi:alanine racemase [archaeon]|nr:alanine racemase [archaeon]
MITLSSYFSSQPSPGEIEERVKGFASWFEVDLDRLGHNLEEVTERAGVEIIPCVKANAYGHGLVPVVAYLMMRGVGRFLVAKLWEAVQLREAGLDCGIINMDPLFTEAQFEEVVSRGVIQTVFRRETVEGLSRAAVGLGVEAEVFVKVDTGLNRVGVRHGEAADLIEYVSSLPGLRVGGMFSTFTESHEFDEVQLSRMLVLDGELRRRGIVVPNKSMASSNAVFHFPESYLDAVRPGIMLLGIYPEPGDRGIGIELRASLSFKARLEHVKWVEEDEAVTYSRRFVAPRRMRVGTVHAGYSDGYPRGLTKKGVVRVGGEVRSVLGTVSVNHHVVDVDGLDVGVGDVVELISREGENSLEALAGLAGIMVYKFCVELNPLIPRVYVEGGVPVAVWEPRLV